jgi:uncharacterized protein YkwD
MQLNWVDWIIIALLVYEVYDGWSIGLISLGSSFLAFSAALWLALRFNIPVSAFLTEKFGLPSPWGSIFGYIAVAVFSSILFSVIIRRSVLHIPLKIIKSKINNSLGSLLSVMNGFLVISFIIVLISALPLRGTVKDDIKNSVLGSMILQASDAYGGSLKKSIDQLESRIVRFTTINPGSGQSMNLDIEPQASDLAVDEVSENKMVDLVNAERVKVGVPALKIDKKITEVARAHSRDMFMRRYFSHISPEGKSPADRFNASGVGYSVMGENIGYSPDVLSGHQGLMNSPEHKRNILSTEYHRIGIGIISTKIYGIMITQDFAN